MIRAMGSFALIAVALYTAPVAAEQAKQKTFATPEEAAQSLFAAVQSGNEQALSQVVGDDRQILSCGDERQDELERQNFVEKYREMHRIGKEGDFAVLYVGAENWPFPIPLMSTGGAWSFDTRTGGEEILLRRIGENELSAIDVSRALEQLDEQDAVRVVGNTAPLNGYLFRKIPAEGKRPAFVAYPAEYGSSGIMTFVVGANGVVYERDLGPRTAKVVGTVNSGKLDAKWHALDD